MGRKKKPEEHENLERWLVSYADFITLLFATFVVLYALAQADLAQIQELKESLKKAFSSSSVVQGQNGILDQSGDSILSEMYEEAPNMFSPFFEGSRIEKEKKDFNEFKEDLDKFNAENQIDGIQTKIDERGLSISLIDSLFFDSGSAVVRKEAYPALNKIGQLLKQKFNDHIIRIEGHTDNLPIKNPAIYPSNWELSSARASSVVRMFINSYQLKNNKLSAIGYAESRPILSNNTEKGRQKNRRVEIVVLKSNLIKSELHPKTKKDSERIPKENQQHSTNTTGSKTGIAKPSSKSQLSDAAKKLMEESGQSINDVILYTDPNQSDNDKQKALMKLKEQENQYNHNKEQTEGKLKKSMSH